MGLIRRWSLGVAACGLLALGAAGCGGGSDDDAAGDATSAAATATAPVDGVTPEIRAATEAVIAHLVAQGAVPDPDAGAGIGEFDRAQRLLLPAGGDGCKVLRIGAGSAQLADLVASGAFGVAVRDPGETVAIAMELPDADPSSPRSSLCVDAATAALVGFGSGAGGGTGATTPSAPAAGAGAAVGGAGVTDVTGGLYVGALVENTSGSDLVDVAVGFDLLDRQGRVIGATPPVELPLLLAGRTGAAGGTATAQECGCAPARVASVRARVTVGRDTGSTGLETPEVVDAAVASGAGGLQVTGTVQNPGDRPLDAFTTVSYVLLDAQGRVLTGAAGRVGSEVPAGGSAPLSLTAPASLAPSLPRPAADVRVTILD